MLSEDKYCGNTVAMRVVLGLSAKFPPNFGYISIIIYRKPPSKVRLKMAPKWQKKGNNQINRKGRERERRRERVGRLSKVLK